MFVKRGAAPRWPEADGLHLVPAKGPETGLLTCQSSSADIGKGWAAGEEYLASVTTEEFKQQSTPLSQCVLSHLFISQEARTQVLSWPGQLMAPRYVQVLRRLGLQTAS